MIDLYVLYTIIKRISTPFNKWSAFKSGVIDKDGNIIVDKNDRTSQQKDSFSKLDLLVLKLKRALEKVPGMNSKLATYAAALWLLKEQNISEEDAELISESDAEGFIKESYGLVKSHEINRMFDEIFEDAPVNSAGGGAIDGIGVGPKGEPGFTKRVMNKYKKKNMEYQHKELKDGTNL